MFHRRRISFIGSIRHPLVSVQGVNTFKQSLLYLLASGHSLPTALDHQHKQPASFPFFGVQLLTALLCHMTKLQITCSPRKQHQKRSQPHHQATGTRKSTHAAISRWPCGTCCLSTRRYRRRGVRSCTCRRPLPRASQPDRHIHTYMSPNQLRSPLIQKKSTHSSSNSAIDLALPRTAVRRTDRPHDKHLRYLHRPAR